MFDLEPSNPESPFYGLLSLLVSALSLVLGFAIAHGVGGAIKVICYGFVYFGPVAGIGFAATAFSRHEAFRWLAYGGVVLGVC
jgi:hypothetical protein